jgi:hypothetical protein
MDSKILINIMFGWLKFGFKPLKLTPEYCYLKWKKNTKYKVIVYQSNDTHLD